MTGNVYYAIAGVAPQPSYYPAVSLNQALGAVQSITMGEIALGSWSGATTTTAAPVVITTTRHVLYLGRAVSNSVIVNPVTVELYDPPCEAEVIKVDGETTAPINVSYPILKVYWNPTTNAIYKEVDGFPDTDRDGLWDGIDPDDNGDGILDINDPNHPDYVAPDTDKDGIPDASDGDIDGDGIPNDVDSTPFAPDDPDTDKDGQKDSVDTDDDGDGTPDANDDDDDGDGVPDTSEGNHGSAPNNGNESTAGQSSTIDVGGPSVSGTSDALKGWQPSQELSKYAGAGSSLTPEEIAGLGVDAKTLGTAKGNLVSGLKGWHPFSGLSGISGDFTSLDVPLAGTTVHVSLPVDLPVINWFRNCCLFAVYLTSVWHVFRVLKI